MMVPITKVEQHGTSRGRAQDRWSSDCGDTPRPVGTGRAGNTDENTNSMWATEALTMLESTPREDTEKSSEIPKFKV